MANGEDDLYYYYELWRHLQDVRERKKKEPEWVKELLQEPSEKREAEGDLVRRYLQAALEQSRRAVKQLEREIYVRTNLHDQAVEQLDYQITQAAHSLERFRGWGVGYNRGVDQKRVELERTLGDLRKEKRSWRVRFWDDLVRLRAELRERRRDYEAALRRSDLRLGDGSGR